MKKTLMITTIALLVLSALFSSCGEGEDVKVIGSTVSQSGSTTPDKTSYSSGGFVFEFNGASVEMDALADPLIKQMGDNYEYFESASCAFDGKDKSYIYPHFELLTYPSKDGDRVQAIYLKDDLVTTKEGLYIGSPLADMQRLYGEGTRSGNEYTFEKGGMELKIQVTDDKVSYITYASMVLGTVTGQ